MAWRKEKKNWMLCVTPPQTKIETFWSSWSTIKQVSFSSPLSLSLSLSLACHSVYKCFSKNLQRNLDRALVTVWDRLPQVIKQKLELYLPAALLAQGQWH